MIQFTGIDKFLSADKIIRMGRGLSFFAAWYSFASATLVFSVLFSIYLTVPQTKSYRSTPYRLYQALPSDQIQISQSVSHGDGRNLVVENFFRSYNSVLASYADLFVIVADFYHLDYRLLPAIAMQESNGAKRTPKGSNNPFGYGIYGSKLLTFSSWEEAIETVGKNLREDYLNQGLHTPAQIMTKYTPPSIAKGGPWAIGVSQFMEELK